MLLLLKSGEFHKNVKECPWHKYYHCAKLQVTAPECVCVGGATGVFQTRVHQNFEHDIEKKQQYIFPNFVLKSKWNVLLKFCKKFNLRQMPSIEHFSLSY